MRQIDPEYLVDGHSQVGRTTRDQIANIFSRRPNQDTALKFYSAGNPAFTTWAEITGVAKSA